MTTKGDVIVTVADYAMEHFPHTRSNSFVPASGVVITPEDITIVVQAALDGWFTDYRHGSLFRKGLCEYVNQNFCVLVNSGSSANLVALTALLEGDKRKFVMTLACGFPTTIAPIYQNNKIPLYIDIDPNTLLPKMDQIEYALDHYGNDICGAIFTHTMGFPYDERKIKNMLGLDRFLIADCCDALGAKLVYDHEEYSVGSFATASTYSFFPAHQITTGEGGAILTNKKELADNMLSYSNWGRDCHCLPGQSNVCGTRFDGIYGDLPPGFDHKYVFSKVGYNLKMTELSAALGLSQLRWIEKVVQSRRSNYARLKASIKKFRTVDTSHIPSPFGFVLTSDVPAEKMVELFENRRVSTRRMFGGNITRQPGFENLPYIYIDLRGSNEVLEHMFWVGCHPGLSEDDLEMIEATIRVAEDTYL